MEDNFQLYVLPANINKGDNLFLYSKDGHFLVSARLQNSPSAIKLLDVIGLLILRTQWNLQVNQFTIVGGTSVLELLICVSVLPVRKPVLQKILTTRNVSRVRTV